MLHLHHSRKLGRRRVVNDARIPLLRDRLTSKFPNPPPSANWYADLPDSGLPMLLNDTLGDCVAASCLHYLEMATAYTRPGNGLKPTAADALALYEQSGYRPSDPHNPQSNESDQGWWTLGRGGLMQYWASQGVQCGGELNKCGPVAAVNFYDRFELKSAISLFGFVMIGAQLSESDMENTNNQWDAHTGPIVGGHEFLFAGYETLGNEVWFDVLTWDGHWRASWNWVKKAVDEALVVYDADFFTQAGVSAAGIDAQTLQADLALFQGQPA